MRRIISYVVLLTILAGAMTTVVVVLNGERMWWLALGAFIVACVVAVTLAEDFREDLERSRSKAAARAQEKAETKNRLAVRGFLEAAGQAQNGTGRDRLGFGPRD